MKSRASVISVIAAILAVTSVPVLLNPASANEESAARYTLGGTLVADDSQFGAGTPVDDGALVCSASTGDGIGGTCIRWDQLKPDQDSVLVHDDLGGTAVAFQVCIDNDGDGICGGDAQFGPIGGTGGNCVDEFFFSHDDAGNFFNPLGPLPTTFRPGCEGSAGFPGWIVYACQGAHSTRNGGAHHHPSTQGWVFPTSGGSGYGTFCGGGPFFDPQRNSTTNENEKRYELTP